MSANVESMFYAGREKPWHGLGTQVEEAPTSADALRLAGLDWTVQRKPIQVCGGRKVDNFFANVRSSDGGVYDAYPGGLQQHSEHRTERRKACVVCPAYRRHSGQAPGGADVSGHGE